MDSVGRGESTNIFFDTTTCHGNADVDRRDHILFLEYLYVDDIQWYAVL